MRIEKLTDFQFDGQKIRIEKIKKFSIAKQFKDECLPLVVPHLRPLEVIVSAILNQYAPPDMALATSIIYSEKEMDDAIVPAFKKMLTYYLPNRTYEDEQLDTILPGMDVLYCIVYSQMTTENLFEFYLKRKYTFIDDLCRFLNIGIQLSDLMSNLESAIQRAVVSDPDNELSKEVHTG